MSSEPEECRHNPTTRRSARLDAHAAKAGSDSPGRSASSRPWYEGLPGREIALAASLLDDIEDWITGDRRRAFEYLRGQVASADACADLPLALVHPDPVLKNVIAKDGAVTIIDWAGAGVGPRIVGAGAVADGRAPANRMASGGARQHRGGVQEQVQLEEREIERLGSALLIRQLWFAAWNYWTRTVKGNPPTGTEWWMPLPSAVYAPLGRVARAAFLG